MKEKLIKILLNPKYIFGVYLIISVITAISKYLRGDYAINNYLIFKNVFFNTIHQKNLFIHYGLRMPRMMPVDEKEVEKAGYSYNSSINPTFLPGRYNNLKVSRTYFKEGNVMQIPASVSPNFRIPLFWLSFHNFPLSLYKKLADDTLKKDQYLNIYFHPWEFAEIKDEAFKLPGFTVKNSGKDMVERFDTFIGWLKDKGYTFGTFQEFQKQIQR